MLESIRIDSFQRIAEASLDLAGTKIHIFSGNNEAGKSSIVEAVAFAIRGISPRVKLKGSFDELIFNGKKSGSVMLKMDGFDVHRSIKGGKLTTTAPLDYPELLVDIQLGRERFGKSDEKALRKMLMNIFGVEGSNEYVTQRLKARGIDDVIIKSCLPLLSAGGFSSAFQAATEKCTEVRGAWTEITGEKYGVNKADDWKPAELLKYPETKAEDLQQAQTNANALKEKRDAAQRAIGVLETASKKAERLNITESLEDLEARLEQIKLNQQQHMDDSTAERKRLETEVESCNTEIDSLKAKIEAAKMAIATLECPACAKPLVLHTEGQNVRLVSVDTPRRDGPSLDSLRAELRDTEGVKTAAVEKRTVKINEFERKFNECIKEAAHINEKITLVKEGVTKITAEDVKQVQTTAEQAEADYQRSLSWFTKLNTDKEQRSRLVQKQLRAKQLHVELNQWDIVATALGNSTDSIPSELLQKTIGPINDTMIKICQHFACQPIVVDSGMHLSRGDGTPYYLLSESAQWRADVVVQLALAALSKLKIVAIDRFDVLQVASRPDFFEMLEWYASQYDVTVLATGTLKSKPDFGDAIKSWWIEEGRVTE